MKIRITQTFATRVKSPAAGNRIHYDSEIAGFGLRVTEKGAKSFILNYVIHGRERRYTIGSLGEYTAETARTKAIELRQQIRDGLDPFAVLEQRKQESLEAQGRVRTLKQLSDAYLEKWAEPNKRPGTVYDDRSLLNGVILPALGDFPIGGIKRTDIADLHASLKDTPYRANRSLALLHHMFTWAMSNDSGEWTIDKNPVDGIRKYHEEKRDRWLSEDELIRLADALDKYPRQCGQGALSEKQREWLQTEARRAMDALRLIMVTGCRKSEALTAKWTDFDLARGVWTKPSHRTKEKKTEHVALNAQALSLLEHMEHTGEYLFPGRAGENLQEIKTPWASVCKLAKLKGVRIHDLRHSFASHLVSSGVSLPVVGKLLGHTQASTTQRYAHLADNPQREAANLFPVILPTARMVQ
ncbi:MAG: site-specific integrase [Terracidiphilus sp.]|nr:site-specific integrase [Terracidiphilus sp.]MDR3798350.1 site-specific integrase [Terracidiphilus sp.]